MRAIKKNYIFHIQSILTIWYYGAIAELLEKFFEKSCSKVAINISLILTQFRIILILDYLGVKEDKLFLKGFFNCPITD